MGRKQTRPGKHIYFCTAVLIFLFLSGCAELLHDIRKQKETRDSLLRSKRYLVWGDYEAAIKENEKVLSLSANNTPSDEALFNLVIIYSHYGNPQSNYGKSIYFFKKLLKDYPKSSLLGGAKIGAKLLEENQRFNKELEKLTQIIEKSKSENQRLNNEIAENQRINKELEKLTQIIEKSKSEKQRLNNKIKGLKQMITESKQVDIEVEQKKREETR